MKKFFLFALAAAFAFTSCTKDETLATAQPGAIDFAVAANNATRSNYDPSISTNGENDTKAISDFAVYGHMRNFEQGTSGEVFREEVVTGSNANGWSYNNTQYWTKNIYYFAALAPYEGRKWTATAISGDYGIGQVQFPNDGTQDLLYWADIVDNRDGAMAKNNTPVSIVFNHLLSKVKFSFENGLTNELSTIKVSDIKITNAYSEGNIDLNTADWWKVEGSNCWKFEKENTTTFAFGNATRTLNGAADTIKIGSQLESDKEMLLFPALDKTYDIEFTVQLLNGEVIALEKTHKVQLTYTFEMGYCYDLKATLTAANITDEELVPITFTVEVKPWVPEGGVEVEVPVTKYENVEVGANQTYTLTGDGEVIGSMSVAGTLDGAKHTLFAQTVPTTNAIINAAGENVTIKNVTLDGNNGVTTDGRGIRNILITKGGVYNITEITSVNNTYALNTATSEVGTINISASTLEGWSSWDKNFTVNLENVKFTNGVNQNGIAPQGVSVFKNCEFAEGFPIHLDRAGFKSITFENCTIGGRALANSDITTAPTVADAVVTIL